MFSLSAAMAFRGRFRLAWTALSSSSRRSCSRVSSPSPNSCLLPEGECALAPYGVIDAAIRNQTRGLYADVAPLGLLNSSSFARASGFCEGDYGGGVLGARIRFRSVELPTRIHSRCFATRNCAEEEDEGRSDDEGARSGDDSKPNRDVKWHVDKLCPTSLRVRQMKEVDFDDIIELEKKLKIVLKVKDLLLADPDRFMLLQDLGKCRDYIGLTGNKRIIAFLKRFPGVFEVHENPEPGRLPWFQFSPEAEALCEEELEIRKGMKVEAVTKVRKLLMMSSDKRLLLGKIAHLARDIGLPDDFRKRLVFKYPKYFRVIEGEDMTNEDGRILELVKWSDRLAVTAEEQRIRDIMEENKLGASFFFLFFSSDCMFS
jgi:hypothetical protein